MWIDIERQVYQGITRAIDDRFSRRPAGAAAGRWSGKERPKTNPLDEYISSGSEHSVDSLLRIPNQKACKMN